MRVGLGVKVGVIVGVRVGVPTAAPVGWAAFGGVALMPAVEAGVGVEGSPTTLKVPLTFHCSPTKISTR